MNYRHAYHAGNFADCIKHALLVWLLRALGRKPTAFFALDTHAGPGRYDLSSEQAQRTGEWRSGIARLIDNPPNPLAGYVDLVQALGLYPGSPAIIRALMRPQDRLACCELNREEYTALRRVFARDKQVAVHHRDGWEGLKALLPPKERRGLVLIDPPFERPDEFTQLTDGLQVAYARFRTGIYAAWYPIKHRTPVRAFHNAMKKSGLHDIVAAELWLREPVDPGRLNGSGMLVVNPPYQFETAIAPILHALLARLGTGEAGAGIACTRLADE
ncbi:MAG: 23S rRNA (adenine(2030)-N(6))-methyltransferase RlmJ [Acetobacteraceae bacterium]|nr:23S rRNA (adenine(2030)-N(6))-methyltransferase RlmJ [Acetobacteraceae bacterium]MBV8525811.1 23S rRNA (adenine(2030)-N(6))-methyltransferase RlmJ [Acetobacteraceae bacterium]MBV8590375.1 23S rRNA (adenine(2030)-N(6))-methyltransferase RlmJ [Acetobacteraceae bacterium]